ncbi:MAG: HAD family hydrolase [Chthoniobacterales bacterium]
MSESQKRALIFDLDDTLIVDEAVSRETFQNVAENTVKFGASPDKFIRDAQAAAKQLWKESSSYTYCRSIGISPYECLWGDFAPDSPDLEALGIWAKNFRVKVFDTALRAQMIDSPAGGEELAKKFEEARRKLQRLMPDAVEVLTTLSQSYRIGMLTNGAPSLQREKIAYSGLAPFFKYIAVSGEHGVGKPQAEIFNIVCSELEVSPDAAVMIGNSLERDIQGAKNAGITSVWMQVPGAEEPADIEPDFTIKSLSELPALLEKLG